ncbi:MAG: hypothetical protein HOC63_11810 [Rhodospirillales bacterium]|jgi:transcription initiation factor IIE alpha subunit|nr:hypothetical protein [Rhodospirillales bacterium]MBT4627363.1 hypothetical protein [Rhodospirillales bacterium]MBT5350905.1 hypothetical protein [Rhodospirillales bacterium]MBT7147024.1 hypothetical protein [Rhodospirillales bacterium]
MVSDNDFNKRLRECSLEELYEMQREKSRFSQQRQVNLETEISIREKTLAYDKQDEMIETIRSVSKETAQETLKEWLWKPVVASVVSSVIAALLVSYFSK